MICPNNQRKIGNRTDILELRRSLKFLSRVQSSRSTYTQSQLQIANELMPSLKQNMFPIGTKRPFSSYRHGGLSDSDFVYFKMPTIKSNDATSMLFCGNPGTLKTTLIKRFVYYYYLKGFKIGIFDLKGGTDWEKTKRDGHTIQLHPDEELTHLNIRVGCPSFVKYNAAPFIERNFETFNVSMLKLAMGNRRVLKTLGFSPSSILKLIPILKKISDPNRCLRISATSRMLYQTRQNLMSNLMDCIENQLFVDTDQFDLNEIWDKNQIWAVCFFHRNRKYVSAYVEHLMREVFYRSLKKENEKYLLVVDDSHIAFGRDLNRDQYGSVQAAIDALSTWRFQGINLILSTQTPTHLIDEVYDLTKHYFIANIGNPEYMRRNINDPDIIDEIRELAYSPARKLIEYKHIFEDKRQNENFFPLGSMVGNVW